MNRTPGQSTHRCYGDVLTRKTRRRIRHSSRCLARAEKVAEPGPGLGRELEATGNELPSKRGKSQIILGPKKEDKCVTCSWHGAGRNPKTAATTTTTATAAMKRQVASCKLRVLLSAAPKSHRIRYWPNKSRLLALPLSLCLSLSVQCVLHVCEAGSSTCNTQAA